MNEVFGNGGDTRAILKELIKSLHDGASPEQIKGTFADVVRDTTPAEIAQVEQELIEEGMFREEIQRLCDVHLALFRESLQREQALAPAGHPIRILMEEHTMLLRFAGELRDFAEQPAHEEELPLALDDDSNVCHSLGDGGVTDYQAAHLDVLGTVKCPISIIGERWPHMVGIDPGLP